jgi:Tol biopolymer transport system component
LVCVLSPVADAQRFGRNKIQYKDHNWAVLSTPHFDIHFYAGGEAFAARAGLVLEDGYEILSYKLKEVLPWRVPVILYSSHNDFLQTNVISSLLSEGVQAFAEPSRRRIVLPFTSSFKEFSHTAIHELAHVFTFHIVYNQMLDNVFTRNYLFPMPLWVAEGLAEYLSVGWDADSDMFIRDAVIHDYLIPFYAVGGFYVYKEGQSVFNYIADTYGHQKVLEILDVLATTRSASEALERTIGVDEEKLYKDWSKALRKHYWPLYPDKVEAEDLGRALTDHIKDHGYYNTKPVLSPDGETVACFSDRSGFIEIYIMSALDGEIVRKLVTGSRSNRFESLKLLTSSLSFSPDGDRLAFVAKSSGHDVLFVLETDSGDEVARIDVGADGMAAPTWSPTSDEIVVSATFNGQTDLVKVDIADGKHTRLTDDPADQLTPKFFPDGKRVAFVFYPEITVPVPGDFDGSNRDALNELDFLDPGNVRNGASYDIWEYDLTTGMQRVLVQSPGDDTEPLVLADGVTMIYASDVSGVSNLHSANLETGESYRFTDVLGGLFTPSVHEEKGRIAFSAFVKGGWDVFVSDDLEGMLARRYTDVDSGVLAHRPDTATDDLDADDAGVVTAAEGAQAMDVVTLVEVDGDSLGGRAGDENAGSEDGEIDVETYKPVIKRMPAAQPSDTQEKPVEGITEEVPGEEVVHRGGRIGNYKTRLSPDFIGQGAGLFYSTGFGFGLSNTIALSDILGDHRLIFSFNLFGELADSDFLLTYYYLKKRVDYGFGVFHFKNYLNSRATSIGEGFANYQLFSERNYGVFGLVSVPFNKFYRMDLGLQAYVSDREFFEQSDPSQTGFFFLRREENSRRLVEPSLSFVHDSSFYGPFGPVEGSRWRAEISRGIGFTDKDVSRTTGYLDYRWYRRLWYRNSIAFRMLGGGSVGADQRTFYLGGPLAMRGFDWDDPRVRGSRFAMTSVEYRFPLVDALVFGWPGRWGFFNIGGTAFFDVGMAWDNDLDPGFDNDDPVLFRDDVSGVQFQDLKGDFGFGTYFNIGFLLLNFQFAWQTDLKQTGDYQFHFFVGPTF